MNIHIIAIAGKMTAPLALELKKHGHRLTGSDQPKIFPPFCTLLKKNHIPVNQTAINSKIDLVIVGSSYKKFSNTRQAYQTAKRKAIPTISATKYIAQNIAKSNSILVAGSFGKTTITSLLAQILINSKLDPSYLIGGPNLNNIPSAKITSSSWSVIEADESINGLDRQAKFLYYPAKYVIITSVAWEHIDSYPTFKKNLEAYKALIKKIPKDGLLIYNHQDEDLRNLTKYCQAKTYPYDSRLTLQTKLIGKYNYQNIQAAYTISKYLGLNDSVIRSTIKNFKGVAGRLQLIANYKNIIFIDDFAQSIPRIKSSILALKNQYSGRPIKLLFEPHASFLLQKSSIKGLKLAFTNCTQVVISKIPYQKEISKNNRSTAADFKRELGKKATYLPLWPDIFHFYTKSLKPNDILIHMSSGGLTGQKTFKSIINYFKKDQ